MHKLGHWSAKRSGAHLVIHGFNQAGEPEKFTAREITGPSERDLAPTSVLAVKLDGSHVALVPGFDGAITRA